MKLSFKKDSEVHLSKLNDGEISLKTLIGKKSTKQENNLSVLISDSKGQIKQVELTVDHRSLKYTTITPSSAESKHTNKSSELSEQRCSANEGKQ